MSHDGRYAAWLSSPPPGPPTCRALTLDVYEVETATEIASTRLDVPEADEPPVLNLPEYFAGGCGHVEGIDDLGRVYVTIGHQRPDLVLDVWMYELSTRHWTPVTNLPEGSGRFDSLNYVTADGFAAPAEQYVVAYDRSVGLSSVEGTVDAQGRFDRQRRVPVGRGLWSPDRSRVVEQRPEGVVIRSASTLDTWRVLDLPPDQFRLNHESPHPLNLQWDSPDHVLVVSMAANDGHTVYRCDASSAACDVIDHPGELALGNNAQPQGGG